MPTERMFAKVKFVVINTPAGRQEQRGIGFPLRPPWIVVHQHYVVPKKWKEFCAQIPPTFELSYHWGEKVYQTDGQGGVELCGYWYDTSD